MLERAMRDTMAMVIVLSVIAGSTRCQSTFEKASKSLKDPELKGFAEKTLPTLRGHLEHVKKVEASHGKGAEKKASS